MIELQNFYESEFGIWADRMSEHVLVRLDVLRFRLSRRIDISANPQALGRNNGPLNQSDHNVDYWGKCNGADVFIDGVHNQADANHVIKTAKELGFTAIGVYPEWTNNHGEQQVGFHLAYRPTKKMGHPALWGRVNGEYVSIEEALNMIEGSL